MSIKEATLTRLQDAGIPFELYTHAAVSSMEDCLSLPFVTDDLLFCKNILLCNRQKTAYYFYVTLPDKAFRTADVSKKLGVSRLSFAPQEDLPRLLSLESGSLSPLALWWDTEQRISLVLDRDIRGFARLAFHPCDHTATVVFSGSDFFDRLLPSLAHPPIEIA